MLQMDQPWKHTLSERSQSQKKKNDSMYMKYPENTNTQRQKVPARGWAWGFIMGRWTCPRIRLWLWLYNSENLLKVTELHS